MKLADAEQAAETAMLKVHALEKAKNRLQGELEDLMIDVERVSSSPSCYAQHEDIKTMTYLYHFNIKLYTPIKHLKKSYIC